MGTWDHTPFGNDDAMDWLAELDEGDGLEPIGAALAAVVGHDDYLEAPDAVVAVAAAAVLASLIDGAPTGNEGVDAWIAAHRATVPAELRAAAGAALARILAPESELRDLWKEADEADLREWQAGIAELRARVTKAGG